MDSNTFLLRRRAMIAQSGKDPALYRNLWKNTREMQLLDGNWVGGWDGALTTFGRQRSEIRENFYSIRPLVEYGSGSEQIAQIPQGMTSGQRFILSFTVTVNTGWLFYCNGNGNGGVWDYGEVTVNGIVRNVVLEIPGVYRVTWAVILRDAAEWYSEMGARYYLPFYFSFEEIDIEEWEERDAVPYTMEQVQFEKGDVATEWSPHIDDPEE